MVPNSESHAAPLVTAVIPVFNHQEYVLESIRSIIRQTYSNIELIIINDGSQDKSHERILEILPECEKRFVSVEYRNRPNKGLAATLNEALCTTRGEYFSVLGSDDIVLPDKFNLLVQALEHPRNHDCAAAFGNASFIDENGRDVKANIYCKISEGREHHFNTFVDMCTSRLDFDSSASEFGSYRTLLFSNYLPAMANIVRTDCIRAVGGWTPGNVIEDWEMWLKLSKNNRILFIDKVLALYRIHGRNSFDTIREDILYARLNLITREKQYCVQHGLSGAWRRSINNQLYQLLRDGKSPLHHRLRELNRSGPFSFLGYMFSGGLRTFRRVIRGEP